MADVETLGVPAHRGGLVVRRPELTVGVVQMVSRPSGLAVELLARRPLDRRSAAERQSDIRAGRGAPAPAPRRLLPPYDEGMELRVGWLDAAERAHWEFGSSSSSGGEDGPSLRTVLDLPPLFEHVSIVLAWPEIGFPETVLSLPLPDRATVERHAVSIWHAPLDARPVPESLPYRDAAALPAQAVEAGRVVAGPQVVNRSDQAVVVLTRLTSLGPVLAAQLVGLARNDVADRVMDTGEGTDPERLSSGRASIAVVEGSVALRGQSQEATLTGGPGSCLVTDEFLLSRPAGDTVDLVVAWPAAGLPAVRVTIPLGPG